MATAKKSALSEIKAANKALGACIAAGDAAGAAALYSKKPMLMPPNAKAAKSARAIKAFWQGAIDMGVKNAILRTIEIDQHGRTLNEVGAFTLKGARGKVLDKGSYVVVWKREGKDWKLHWDIFNSDNPA